MANVFGFQTVEEANEAIRQRWIENNQRVQAMGRNAPPGVQVGQALANMFGGRVKRALDTRTARKEERDRLMETQGLSKDEARDVAKATISPEFAEVRKAKRMEEISLGGRSVMDELIANGVPAARAQAVGMFEVAKRLSEQGFPEEASALRVQASELLQQQDKADAELANLRARTSASTASAESTRASMRANDDTFIKINNDGSISDAKSMPLTDAEGRQRLRDRGYINVGNGAFGIQFNREDFAGAPKEIPRGTQEDIIGGLNMLSSIDVLRSINHQTGFIEGPARSAMAALGITAFNNEGFVDAVAVRRKMRADIQSIIKGIPSNYDAGIFERMIPDPGAFKSRRFYDAQLDVLESATRELVELTIAFHQGTQKPIPKDVLNAAYAAGIRPQEVEPMDADEIETIKKNPDNNVFTAHQKQLEMQAELFKNSQNTLETPERQQEVNDAISYYLTEDE